jgi:hypothetical protein
MGGQRKAPATLPTVKTATDGIGAGQATGSFRTGAEKSRPPPRPPADFDLQTVQPVASHNTD